MSPAQWQRLVGAALAAGWPRECLTVGLRPRPAVADAPADWQATATRHNGAAGLTVATSVSAAGATPDAAVEAVCAILGGAS